MLRNATIALLISLFAFMENVQGQTFTVVTPSNHTVYFQIENGAAEATYQTYGMPNYGSSIVGTLIIPDSVEYNSVRYPVTAIGYNAFHHSGYIDTVVLPNTITEIKQNAFCACYNLVSVTYPQLCNNTWMGLVCIMSQSVGPDYWRICDNHRATGI